MSDEVTNEVQQENTGTTSIEWDFDFPNIKARDIRDLNEAIRTVDIDTAAAIYARIITKCPSVFGAPDQIETYLEMPFYLAFQDIPAKMGAASKNARKS